MKDVTQDANLLVPGMPSVSNNGSTAQDTTKDVDLLDTDENGAAKARTQNSRLLKLPMEIKQTIWTMAVTCEEPITPCQVTPRSNKFVWNADQASKLSQKPTEVSAAIPLAVVSLTKTCKEMYADISLTHLFYRNNHFDFSRFHNHMNTYLVAITDERRRSIGSMQFTWAVGRGWYKDKMCQTMVLIASCKSLWSLKISINACESIQDASTFFSKQPEYKLTFAVS
ncbi:hypothetical protein ONS95_013182 [Cadophora gregata]|uniref:uncharacterized protein n=1 Tax=Cadophora gregata TaxID=51156 RepID=UPI0026DAC8D2|nr:uncharacterized protein ONS95_013182 [Cadophora gregata]KAK0100000.1 hypothetical protein ONS96_007943 [Cadophora gregata f. sp. sojae]KAK0116151.1 hypothetical protein ONS95_013182 [Cadophora gregata]